MREIVVSKLSGLTVNVIEVGQSGFIHGGCALTNLCADSVTRSLGKELTDGRWSLVIELQAKGNSCDASAREKFYEHIQVLFCFVLFLLLFYRSHTLNSILPLIFKSIHIRTELV